VISIFEILNTLRLHSQDQEQLGLFLTREELSLLLAHIAKLSRKPQIYNHEQAGSVSNLAAQDFGTDGED
jgi:hypothetical protein